MFEAVRKNLEAKGYAVSYFETAEQAADYLNAAIDGKSVGLGGSMTLEEMGLYERLVTHNTVHWHQRIPEGKTSAEVRLAANECAIYISSVNGLAETGEIVNIDGNCNRVAAIFYGGKEREKVYLVAGVNKLAKDPDGALWRARNVAAPRNAKRLGMRTPCAAKADRCYDCKSPERICRGLSVLWSKPMTGAFEVVLVGEPLGY
ncbi:MAG: lactate utilization protein [Clostridia bacterium]|nr:lactate utilization protein [Clostridia bacterium]